MTRLLWRRGGIVHVFMFFGKQRRSFIVYCAHSFCQSDIDSINLVICEQCPRPVLVECRALARDASLLDCCPLELPTCSSFGLSLALDHSLCRLPTGRIRLVICEQRKSPLLVQYRALARDTRQNLLSVTCISFSLTLVDVGVGR